MTEPTIIATDVQPGTRVATVSISKYDSPATPVLVVEDATVSSLGEHGFRIEAFHSSAVDEDHSSARLLRLDGAGPLTVSHATARGTTMRGVILSAWFYPDGKAPDPRDVGVDGCPNSHGFMDYLPPKQKWKPGLYDIRVRLSRHKADDS